MKFRINTEDLNNFTVKCDALCSSKLILSDKKISDILKCIASSEDFCRFIEACIKDFNYKIEFLKAKVPDAEKQGKSNLILPEGEKLAAFTFCLLCEFDNKQRDLTEFLTEFYGLDELFTDGFLNFCNGIIIPFKNTVIMLAGNEEKEETVKSDFDFSSELISVPETEYNKINKLCGELIRNITREALLKANEREDYILMVKAFLSALEGGNKKITDLLMVSLKYMCVNFKFLNKKVKQIEKILNGSAAEINDDV